jgi:hypothetical protein
MLDRLSSPPRFATPRTTTSIVGEQRLRVLQIRRVEAFGERRVQRGEQIAGGVAFALIAPEAREARGGAQLERLRLLRTRDVAGLPEVLFRRGCTGRPTVPLRRTTSPCSRWSSAS